MNATKLVFAGLVLFGVVMGVWLLRPDAGPAQDALARVQSAGVLTIGYANEAPFAYLDPSTNRVTGEAVEVARAVAKRLGIAQVDGVLTEFGALIPGLQAGRYDLIAAGMYITAPRAQQVAFTDPTYVVGEGFLVPKGNSKKLHSFADVVAHADARLGVVAGAVEHGYARALGVPEDRIVVFPDNASGVAGLRAGRCDALALTSLTIRDLLQRGADQVLESATPFTDPVIDGRPVRGHGAFALRTADVALREAFNRELRAFLGTPEHAALVQPFGFGPEHLPKGITVEQVLGNGAP
ncbi:MAG: ectoine/hydroxyectoine ABC transporter substrate-binding protein EhuB [Planctomycetes bacterium]|jgi:polar amino acid transport system substrate-binding protein|nr:ectoine/hydroxyectoine ABC transporter substrate-binding protein EhuB [Planctomycetota bacterium]